MSYNKHVVIGMSAPHSSKGERSVAFVALTDFPGQEPGTNWRTYEEARDDLYERCGSDRVYEDVMNGLAYLDNNDQVHYYPARDDY
jgi:hypothetical protein